MDKYEYRLKTEQIKKLMDPKDVETSMEIADTLDFHRERDVKLLTLISEVYAANKKYEVAIEFLLQAYEYAPIGRRILYRLTELATESGNIDAAEVYYEEFLSVAKRDQSQYILKYEIERKKGAPLDKLIKILEDYKELDFDERWSYELAELYDEAGRVKDCVNLCDDIILWFSLGKYVERAMELKMKHEPLTDSQKEKMVNKTKYIEQLRQVEKEYGSFIEEPEETGQSDFEEDGEDQDLSTESDQNPEYGPETENKTALSDSKNTDTDDELDQDVTTQHSDDLNTDNIKNDDASAKDNSNSERDGDEDHEQDAEDDLETSSGRTAKNRSFGSRLKFDFLHFGLGMDDEDDDEEEDEAKLDEIDLDQEEETEGDSDASPEEGNNDMDSESTVLSDTENTVGDAADGDITETAEETLDADTDKTSSSDFDKDTISDSNSNTGDSTMKELVHRDLNFADGEIDTDLSSDDSEDTGHEEAKDTGREETVNADEEPQSIVPVAETLVVEEDDMHFSEGEKPVTAVEVRIPVAPVHALNPPVNSEEELSEKVQRKTRVLMSEDENLDPLTEQLIWGITDYGDVVTEDSAPALTPIEEYLQSLEAKEQEEKRIAQEEAEKAAAIEAEIQAELAIKIQQQQREAALKKKIEEAERHFEQFSAEDQLYAIVTSTEMSNASKMVAIASLVEALNVTDELEGCMQRVHTIYEIKPGAVETEMDNLRLALIDPDSELTQQIEEQEEAEALEELEQEEQMKSDQPISDAEDETEDSESTSDGEETTGADNEEGIEETDMPETEADMTESENAESETEEAEIQESKAEESETTELEKPVAETEELEASEVETQEQSETSQADMTESGNVEPDISEAETEELESETEKSETEEPELAEGATTGAEVETSEQSETSETQEPDQEAEPDTAEAVTEVESETEAVTSEVEALEAQEPELDSEIESDMTQPAVSDSAIDADLNDALADAFKAAEEASAAKRLEEMEETARELEEKHRLEAEQESSKKVAETETTEPSEDTMYAEPSEASETAEFEESEESAKTTEIPESKDEDGDEEVDSDEKAALNKLVEELRRRNLPEQEETVIGEEQYSQQEASTDVEIAQPIESKVGIINEDEEFAPRVGIIDETEPEDQDYDSTGASMVDNDEMEGEQQTGSVAEADINNTEIEEEQKQAEDRTADQPMETKNDSEDISQTADSYERDATEFDNRHYVNVFVKSDKPEAGYRFALEYLKKLPQSQRPGSVAKTNGMKLSTKGVSASMDKLKNRILIIEQAGQLSQVTLEELYQFLKEHNDCLLMLIDSQLAIDKIKKKHPLLADMIGKELLYVDMSADELVQHAKIYAGEQDCVIDDMGTLALYAIIEHVLQTTDGSLLSEVEAIVDDAIESAERLSIGNLVKGVFGSKYNKAGQLILKEQHFSKIKKTGEKK